ncbi:hypothetical protein D3C80_1327370 [compost metagenome]
MGEQHGRVTGRVARLNQDRPVHVGVAARLQHHRAAQVVEPFAHGAAFLKDRRAFDAQSGCVEDADRLARRMHVDDGEAIRPVSQLVHADHSLFPPMAFAGSDNVYYVIVRSFNA